MVHFFKTSNQQYYAVDTQHNLSPENTDKLIWLFSNAEYLGEKKISGHFLGSRKEMITPWSTNAVEICQNMGIQGVQRIESFSVFQKGSDYDALLEAVYEGLDQNIFSIDRFPDQGILVNDLQAYNQQEGLALSEEEIKFLEHVSADLGRPLTDSEVFGFSQVNSEHCRHKIFNGTFIIDGREQPLTLFQLIKKTAKENPNYLVSAYKDNVAFIKGPKIVQFAPNQGDQPDYFVLKDIESVISLKAETHNFPTTVEPFNGAATGSGGEIRDRLAGGKGSLPLAGTAVYITAYPRLDQNRRWEKHFQERRWLYHTPDDILIKASNGASDFGNKFGQPLIGGSLLTFEHFEGSARYGFDKVIMLAGGVGFGKAKDCQKEALAVGDKIVLLGGDNYRIGMGGAAVSSVSTGHYANALELNAVQRSNPEMQKRVMNAIRAMVELDQNPMKSIHDHGAGGHLNCFSELLEDTGGELHLDQLPVGDPTLSDKELISNESQERMGLAIDEEHLAYLKRSAERERAPLYVVGEATGDRRFIFKNQKTGKEPVNISLDHLFGSSPKTIIEDQDKPLHFKEVVFDETTILTSLEQVLQLEAVACKDWLTNKVDRSVTGKVAMQQACGPLQLPLNNVSVMALDFTSHKGVGTGIGHAPGPALIDPAKGSKLAISESLLNLIWAPLSYGIKSVSLSANWMWPMKPKGESARLYQAVQAVSEFACELGINIPTGKDSLSMTQQYPNDEAVHAPGTVIITAVGEVDDIRKSISPNLLPIVESELLYIDFSGDEFHLGGSSLAQTLGFVGTNCPTILQPAYFVQAFEAVQVLIKNGDVLAGHDVSSGGLLTTLLEMCFPNNELGIEVVWERLLNSTFQVGFSEKPAIVIQVKNGRSVIEQLKANGVSAELLGKVQFQRTITLGSLSLDIDALRAKWYHTSYLFDNIQQSSDHAQRRKDNIFKQPLEYHFLPTFSGQCKQFNIELGRKTSSGIKAAIIREKGVNGDREMAYALHLAGFDVKDVHMTDLVSGREDLTTVQMIVFVGGFSNSDVMGSAKGWAGAFLYNEKAKSALDQFYKRPDTLSLGVCNGCQLMMELGLINQQMTLSEHPKMGVNGSGKFESIFSLLTIPENNSIMFRSLAGSTIGAWVAHGEGRFVLPTIDTCSIVAQYAHNQYPGNPNDSDFSTAALCSIDGRHLAIMPHIERSLFPWNWPHYPKDKLVDQISPWVEAFVNARLWVEKIE